MRFRQVEIDLKKGDITLEEVDAIVNAANSSLMMGGGVDGAIHKVGGPAILEECKKIIAQCGECPTGKAVITSGGNLKAKYVIHSVGPIWQGGNHQEPQFLRDAYLNSLALAEKNGAKSIAFPSISTGAYGYPIEKAAPIALQAVWDYTHEHSQFWEIRFVLFSDSDLSIYEHAILSFHK